MIEFRREQAGRLPAVEEFGQVIAEAAANPRSLRFFAGYLSPLIPSRLGVLA